MDGSGTESVAILLDPGSLPSGVPRGLLEGAAGRSPESITIRSQNRKVTLADRFEEAATAGRIQGASLDSLPADVFEEHPVPRPAGYPAQTKVYFGGVPVSVLLDWCATCSAIPEEVACMLISRLGSGPGRDAVQGGPSLPYHADGSLHAPYLRNRCRLAERHGGAVWTASESGVCPHPRYVGGRPSSS